MLDNLGICKGPGDVILEIRVGSDFMTISKIGRYFYTLINNRTIIGAKSEKDLITRINPIVSVILKKMIKNAQLDAIRWRPVDKNYTKMTDNFLKQIDNDLTPYEITVLELKPDEIQDNRTTGYQASDGFIDKLENYRQELKKISETMEDIHHTSDILLKTKLDRNIWGNRKMMSVFHTIKTGFNELVNKFEKTDYWFESSDNNIRKLQAMINKKIASRDVISNIIENFSMLKSFISELVQKLYKLYLIDNTFKTHTGYPATWFLDSSILMDFIFEYENLISYLIKMTIIELSTIEPLLIKKVTGV